MFRGVVVLLGVFLSISVNAKRVDLDREFLNTTDGEFKEAILETKVSMSDWVQGLEKDSPELICLGETHNKKYREFYAKNFFNNYSMDTLFLEARQEQVDAFLHAVDKGESDVILLGADISEILKAAINKNPSIRVYGVELTQEQKTKRTFDRTGAITREGYIAQNIMDKFVRGEKHVMLYGANHCAANDLGLGGAIPAYKLLQKVLPKGKTRSVKAFFYSPSDYFSVILTILGIESETMVIRNANKINPLKYQYNWKQRGILKNFQDIIYVK